MKAPAGLEKVNWTRLRWLIAVVMVMAIHLILILWFSDWTPLAARESPNPHQILLGDVEQLEVLASQLGDPTLFALPTRRGFAGQGWGFSRQNRPPAHGLGDGTDWLELETTGLGSRFLEATPPLTSRLTSATRQPPVRLAAPSIPVLPRPTASQLLLDANLTARQLLEPVALPSVVHSNVLADTILRVAVAPDGSIFSAVVIQSSGSTQADTLGLSAIRSLRFGGNPGSDKADNAEGTTWGRLTCRWLTLPEGAPSRQPG